MSKVINIEDIEDIWKNGEDAYELYIQGQIAKVKLNKALARNKISLMNRSEIIKEITLSELIVLLPTFPVLFRFNFEIVEALLMDTTNFTSNNIYKFIENIRKALEFRKTEEQNLLNIELSLLLQRLADISTKFSTYLGLTIDLYSIINLNIQKEGILDEFLYWTIPKNKSFKEIEQLKEESLNKMISTFKENDTCLTPYIRAKSGINLKQLGQVFHNIGYKSDLEGKIIPIAIDSNFTVGLKDSKEFFINAKGAKKALITNKNEVSSSGYSTRKLSILTSDSKLHPDLDDCGTKTLVPIKIDNFKTFVRYVGKVFKFKNDPNEEYIILEEADYEEVKDMTIYIRTPLACQSHLEGHGICKTCFGDALYELNKEYNVGLCAATFLSNPLTQGLLSTKHNINIDSVEIKWDESNISDYFEIHTNTLVCKPELLDYHIRLPRLDIDTDDDMFETIEIVSKSGNIVSTINAPIPLRLDPALLEAATREPDYYIIENSKFQLNSSVFSYNADNKEAIRMLKSIQKLIERKDRDGIEDAASLLQRLIEVLNESDILLHSSYIEVIIFNLMDNMGRDFSKESYESLPNLLSINEAIPRAAVSKALSFERLKDFFKTPFSYMNTKKSSFDIFFKKVKNKISNTFKKSA